MATATFRSSSLNSYTDSQTSSVVNKPSGVVEGDILFMAVSLFTDSEQLAAEKTITWPSGFSEIKSIYNTTSGEELQLGLAYKIAGASEGSTYTASWTGTEGQKAGVFAYTVGTYNTASPITDSNEGSGADTSIISPALTATHTDDLYISFTTNWNGNSYTQSAGFTERITDSSTSTVWAADKQVAGTGDTGTFTHTLVSTGTAWCCISIILAPLGVVLKDIIGGTGIIPFPR